MPFRGLAPCLKLQSESYLLCCAVLFQNLLGDNEGRCRASDSMPDRGCIALTRFRLGDAFQSTLHCGLRWSQIHTSSMEVHLRALPVRRLAKCTRAHMGLHGPTGMGPGLRRLPGGSPQSLKRGGLGGRRPLRKICHTPFCPTLF